MDRPDQRSPEPTPIDPRLRGLDVVDAVQRRVRDLALTVLPRISLTRVVLVPSYLTLLGSTAAPLRGTRWEFALNLLYALLIFSGVSSEQLRLQRLGFTALRRRLPRGGRRQFDGLWATLAAIVVTAFVGANTGWWWVGAPVGLVAAVITVAARERWAAAFPVALPQGGPLLGGGERTGLPGADGRAPFPGAGERAAFPGGGEASGPFAAPAAWRLAAALALADRARPAVLEARTGLPPGTLEDGLPPLVEARLARILRPDPDGRTVATFTGRGRRAFRRELARLQRG